MNENLTNILITSIGSMSADTVLESLKELESIRVFACDINQKEYLPLASKFEKFFEVPKAAEASYVNEILNICIENNIKLIFPLTDPEVDILSESIKLFHENNITIAISGYDSIKVCRNKLEFYHRLKNIPEIKLIPTFSNKDINAKSVGLPVIAKPAMGRSSQGLYKVTDIPFLEYLMRSPQDYVIQKFILGRIFTVDVARDSFSNFYCVSREELIRTSNGAGLTVEIKKNADIEKLAKLITDELGIIGCINMEFIFDGNNYYLIDINPRFSAGVGFSKMAGYDFIKQCYLIFNNKAIETDNIQLSEGIYGKQYINLKLS